MPVVLGHALAQLVHGLMAVKRAGEPRATPDGGQCRRITNPVGVRSMERMDELRLPLGGLVVARSIPPVDVVSHGRAFGRHRHTQDRQQLENEVPVLLLGEEGVMPPDGVVVGARYQDAAEADVAPVSGQRRRVRDLLWR